MDDKMPIGECFTNFFKYHWRGVLSLVVPLLFCPTFFKHYDEKDYRCFCMIGVMAIYWVFEIIPIYITALIPIVCVPLFGIMGSNKTCIQYFREPLVLFIGSLIMAVGVEFCNLHKRIAFRIIMLFGCSPRRMMLGLMVVSMILSMWMPNAAAVAMLCPILRSMLEEYNDQQIFKAFKDVDPESKDAQDMLIIEDMDTKPASSIATAYYLGIAYASTIGGYATLIGTPTTLAFKGIYETRFTNSTEKITFPAISQYLFPMALIDMLIVYLLLNVTHMGLFQNESKEAAEIAAAADKSDAAVGVIRQKHADLGPMSIHEIQVAIIFVIMVVLLLTRHPGIMDGWMEIMKAEAVESSMPVIMAVILMFVFPMKYTFLRYFYASSGQFTQKEVSSLLNWKHVNKNVPWGYLLLLGGGYCIAEASKVSGMTKMIADTLKGLKGSPTFTVLLLCICFATILTAFVASVPCCNILLPVVAELAIAIKVHPLYLMLPTSIACSIAFMLPGSCLVNSVVCGFGNIRTKNMLFAGILPTVVTIVLLCIFTTTYQSSVFTESKKFPDWA